MKYLFDTWPTSWPKLVLPAALVGGLLFAPVAGAQEADEPPELDDAPAQTSSGRPKPPGASGEAPPQLSEIHPVRSGDTLWDLCAKYLNSPWYWPKIWSYNPQITNPHWIFPGNELRFYPGDENLPTNVEVSSRMEMAPDEDLPRVADDVVSASRAIVVGAVPNRSYNPVGYSIVESQDKAMVGDITNAFEDASMLTATDRLYVRMKSGARPGETYAIYRTIRQIEHPITGEPAGTVVQIVGQARVVATSQTVSTLDVERAFRDIERGDWVGRVPEGFGQRIAPTPTQSGAKGYVIETMETAQRLIGEHDLIFIDRGRAHGVQPGNVFTVLHRGDLGTDETDGLPLEDVGAVMVIDVRENVSTAVVLRSLNEMRIGDKVELRAGT
jgi:hypothetical protein